MTDIIDQVPFLMRLQQLLNPSTIIWVDVMYGFNENDYCEYIGYLKLPKEKYFKGGISQIWNEEMERVAFEDKNSLLSLLYYDKVSLNTMITLSLEERLNIKVNYISLFKAVTI